MPKAPILLAAPALLGVLGLAGCHPHHRASAPAAPASVTAATAAADDGKPPCGCAVKVREPDQVTTTQERVLVTPAGSIDRVIPAVTRSADKTVVVKPAWTQAIAHPAVFRTMWRTQTTPGRAYTATTPARWRTVSDRVLVAPAHTVWRPSQGRPTSGPAAPGYAAYAPTGDVMCAVLVPAQYEVRVRREMISPPRRRIIEGRSETQRVSERVEVSPATSQRVEHPAVTRVVHATEVVTPAHVVSVRTPPVFKLVARTVRTPRYGWRPVPCSHPKRAWTPRPRHAPTHRPRLVERPYTLPPVHGSPYGERG